MDEIALALAAPEPFADGQGFGAAGAYERVHGSARGRLDPQGAQNRGIVDLANAPCDGDGRVGYEIDLFLLRPAAPERASGVLVYDVTNRGAKRILMQLDDAPGGDIAAVDDPRNAADAGLGLLLERGHTLVWSGWDPGVPKANHTLGARFPDVIEDGRPVTGRIRDEFQAGTRGPSELVLRRLPYPLAPGGEGSARLFVRARERDKRREIPREDWEFADAQSIRLLPRGSIFTPLQIYELFYEAIGAKVLGIGFAAVRDLVARLRYDLAEGPPVGHAIGFGNSQSGRFLRHFLELGMNRDGQGRRVFDGIFTNVAGAGKVFANHRFGMPGRTATQHEDRLYPEAWFPFGHAATTDPLSGRAGAILGGGPDDPVVIEVNSASEYWQKGASLVHTLPDGASDAALPAKTRAYLVAGAQHAARPGADPRPGPCGNPRNPLSATPALRALFRALEEWVVDGREPPPSRVPRLADGTLVPADTIAMPPVGSLSPPPAANRILSPVDWTDPPEVPGSAYVTGVSAVDADGNEIAGLRLPPVAVPLGTHTGWNVYRAEPCELCDRDGSFVPFARTKAERLAAGDPRPSLAERYPSRRAYAAAVEAAAAALVAERLLLSADAARYVAEAEREEGF